MSKRILSLVLCCAMLLTCISGLTLISSAAENKVAVFNATAAYRGPGLDMQTKDGFTVFTWTPANRDAIWYNNYMVPNALGITEDTKADELAISLDCYWQKGENAGNDWWQFATTGWTDADNVDSYFNLSQNTENPIEANKWTEYTITRANQVLRRDGADSLFGLGFGDLSAESAFYIRGIKVVAKVGEDTYTALWGSYTRAAIDMTAETIGATNISNVTPHSSVSYDADAKGYKFTAHNNGINFHVDACGLSSEAVAVTVEYNMPVDIVGDNTRFNLQFNGNSHILRVKGADFPGTMNGPGVDLAQGRDATFTYIVTGEDAAALAAGADVQAMLWDGKDGNYYFIKSITFMSADQLNAPADPGYDYYDFTNSYPTNPYYPQYTQPDQVGMTWSLNGTEGVGTVTDKGMEMDHGTLYMNSTRALGKSDVALKFFFAEGTTGNISFQYNADAEKNPDYDGNINFKGINPTIDENGVATVILNDALFANKQASGCSFRIYADGKTLTRVEVYTLADKTALKAAIDGQITDFTGKTEASTNAYKALVAAAQALYDNAFALQADVDAAAAALTSATLKDISVVNFGTTLQCTDLDYMTGKCHLENGDTNIGFTNAGDYLEYEVNVETAGLYLITMSMGTGNSAATVELRNGDDQALGQVIVPQTGWGQYQEYSMKVNLAAGAQKLRIYFAQSSANYQWIKFEEGHFTKEELTAEIAGAIDDLSIYTDETAAAYTEALNAAKEVVAKEDATAEEIDNAMVALVAARAALKADASKVYAQISFENDQINTVNGNILHNHPDEDDGDADNGIYKVADDVDAFGIKMSKQNRGFGFNVDNSKQWLTEGAKVRLVVDYYAPSAVVQDNTRLGINFSGQGFRVVRVGANDGVAVSGLKTDELATFAYTLTAEEVTAMLSKGQVFFFFWNYNDNAETGGDYIYITSARLEIAPDTTALEAAVNENLNLDDYKADSTAAYKEALEAAKAVLANAAASKEEIDNALAALNAAKEQLVALPSLLVSYSDGALTTHNDVEALEFADRWAHFNFSERMGLDTSKVYDLDMTFYYASTGTPWWQIQLSDAEGNRYSEDGKYSANDGFQQTPDWLVNSGDEWTSGKVSFKGVKFPIDDSAWDNKCGTSAECDFGFHICGQTPALDEDGSVLTPANLYIRGIQFTVKDADGNVVGTALWGSKVEIPKVTANLEKAIADAKALDTTMYTEASAKALTDALAAAEATLADENADQDAIDAATDALNAAIAALEMDSWDLIVESVTTTAGLNVKKGESVKIIAVIKNVGTKTIPAGAKYGAAFAVGVKDPDDDTISYETIGWSDNYKTTDAAPELKPGDTLTLTSCGGGANGDGTWSSDEAGDFMLRAFVNDNEGDGIKGEMSRDNNTLEVELKVTEDGLNVETLNAEIAKAEALDLTQYTEDSAKALTDALAAAKAVAANAAATQADVDKAAADLTAAIAALVKTGTTLGDVNGDGTIDTADAVLVLQYAAELIDGTALNTAAADVNGDGTIDTADAVLILQYAAELIKEFPTAAK